MTDPPKEPELEGVAPEVGDALKRFAGARMGWTKAPHGEHGHDRRRWAEFVIAAHRSGKEIDADKLEGYLLSEKFAPDHAKRLVRDYGIGRGLLALYDGRD